MLSALLLLLSVAAHAARGAHAPFVAACQSQDTRCLKLSTQRAVPAVAAGVPELGMEPLDPMRLQRVVANQAGLAMDFRNTVVRGLRDCEVLRVKRLAQRTKLDVKCSVTLVGDYKLGGQLLILPIEGQGRYKIKIQDIVVKMDFAVGERLAGGQRYWTVDSWQHSADVITNADFRFENLFGGNSQLASTVLDFVNENWREIFPEVSPPLLDAIVTKIVGEVQKLFDAVPIDELSLD